MPRLNATMQEMLPLVAAIDRTADAESLVSITEVKHRPDGTTEAAACFLLNQTSDHVMLFHRVDRPWRVATLTLRPPAVTVAYYPKDRPFNLYNWFVPAVGWVGSYVNVVSPRGYRMDAAALHYDDRVIDLLVWPNGSVETLDMDELDELSPPIAAEAVGHADEIAPRVEEIIAKTMRSVVDEVGPSFLL